MAGMLARSAHSMGSRIDRFTKTYALATGAFLAGVKGCLADASSQMTLQRDSMYDPARTVAFGLWSGSYCGGFLYLLYTIVFPRVFPLTTVCGLAHPSARRHIVGMVAFDNFIASPVFFLPSYYVIREALRTMEQGQAWRVVAQPGAVVRTAFETYRSEFWSCVTMTWGMWIPIHTITFGGWIPVHLRVHFTATMSFFTMCAMSVLQGKLEKQRVPKS